MKRTSTWLIRVLHDEVQSAIILFTVTALTVVVSLSSWSSHLISFANTELINDLTLRSFASEWLLCIFFVIAGIELRHELAVGSLNSLRAAAVPAFAALGGMVVPALVFILLSPTPQAWGIAMPTDLPFALAVVAVFGRGVSLPLRAFILSLAIVDDALSVIAISIQSGSFHVHPTLIAIAVGLLLPSKAASTGLQVLRPISSGVALPLFAITALALPLKISDFINDQSFAFTIARLAGKPLGVLAGVAIAIFIARGITSLNWKETAVVGFVCSMGFSVSLLFAATANLSATALTETTAVIVATIPLSALAGGLALQLLVRRGQRPSSA
jgi:NhaA family Na+:H+ antiporter